MKPAEFQITVQHELEHPATDVVEAVAWKLVNCTSRKAVSCTDITDNCALLNYSRVHSAVRNLVASGRLTPLRERNERPMGPKWVTKYKVPTNLMPRLVENTVSTA